MMTQFWSTRGATGRGVAGRTQRSRLNHGSIVAQEPADIVVLSPGQREQAGAAGGSGGGRTGIAAAGHAGAQSAKSPGQGGHACVRPDQGTAIPGEGNRYAPWPDGG